MNLDNLDKAVSLRANLKKVREQLAKARNAGIAFQSYNQYLHVSSETSSAVRTLILADLEKQEKNLVAELKSLGVTEDNAVAGGSKAGIAQALDEALIKSIFVAPIFPVDGRQAFRG